MQFLVYSYFIKNIETYKCQFFYSLNYKLNITCCDTHTLLGYLEICDTHFRLLLRLKQPALVREALKPNLHRMLKASSMLRTKVISV